MAVPKSVCGREKAQRVAIGARIVVGVSFVDNENFKVKNNLTLLLDYAIASQISNRNYDKKTILSRLFKTFLKEFVVIYSTLHFFSILYVNLPRTDAAKHISETGNVTRFRENLFFYWKSIDTPSSPVHIWERRQQFWGVRKIDLTTTCQTDPGPIVNVALTVRIGMHNACISGTISKDSSTYHLWLLHGLLLLLHLG